MGSAATKAIRKQFKDVSWEKREYFGSIYSPAVSIGSLTCYFNI